MKKHTIALMVMLLTFNISSAYAGPAEITAALDGATGANIVDIVAGLKDTESAEDIMSALLNMNVSPRAVGAIFKSVGYGQNVTVQAANSLNSSGLLNVPLESNQMSAIKSASATTTAGDTLVLNGVAGAGGGGGGGGGGLGVGIDISGA